MDYISARAGVDSARLSGESRFAFSQGLGASAPELREYLDTLRQDIEAQGFTVSSGPNWRVVGLPAVSGSNAELQAKNAENEAQRQAWNAEIEDTQRTLAELVSAAASITPVENIYGTDVTPVPDGQTVNYGSLLQQHQQAVAAGNWELADALAKQINAVTAAGPQTGGVPLTTNPAVDTSAGNVYSPAELEEIRIADAVRGDQMSPHPTPIDAWLAQYPFLVKWLSAAEIESWRRRGDNTAVVSVTTSEPLPPDEPTTGGFFPGNVDAPFPTVAVVEDTPTGGKVKGQEYQLTPGYQSFTPTPNYVPDDDIIPEPMTTQAGVGGGVLGLLALGALALAMLKRKR